MKYYQELLKLYIKYCDENTPIFIEEIKRFFKGVSRTPEEYDNTIKKIYVSVNRLVRKGYLKHSLMGSIIKGVYLKKML